MDQRLISALENLGNALEEIASALQSKEEAKTSSVKALQAGDFGKQLESINVQLKSIKSDTQEILRQQKTIQSLSKEKEIKKETPMEEIGKDKKKESALKQGIGTILLIAVAVLAIGMAFKLVGRVDFLSVVSLGLAIWVVAQAFEKVAKLKLTLRESLVASLTMVTMAFAITASSWILQKIAPVSLLKLLTAVAIAGVFAVIGLSLEKLAKGISTFENILGKKTSWATPLVMIAVATGITGSSWIMSGIRPIGILQALTAIAIAAVFTVIGMSLEKIAKAIAITDKILGKKATYLFPLILVAVATAITFSSMIMSYIEPIGLMQALTAIAISAVFMIIGFSIVKIADAIAIIDKKLGAKKAALLLPLVLIAIAGAITISSLIMSKIQPIGMMQFLTALGIALLFGLMSFFFTPIAVGVKIIDKALGKGAAFLVPLVFVAISLAIMLSSHILSMTADIDYKKILQIANFGLALGLVVLAMLPSVLLVGIAAASGVGALAIGLGVLMIPLIAGAIAVSSHIIAMGKYDKQPGLSWILSVGASMIGFGTAAIILGGLAITGIGAVAILAGAALIPVIAESIVDTDETIRKGVYDKSPSLDWALGVGASMTGFGLAVLTLGSFIVGSLGLGYVALEAGKVAVGMIAQSIVDVAWIFNKNSAAFKKGPTKEWSEGVSIAIGAFAPVYSMLTKGGIISLFTGTGPNSKQFADAIRIISRGIVDAAWYFAGAKVAFKGGPKEEWSRGIGKAISAFAPIYKILSDEKGWFGTGVSIEQYRDAILTITRGIITAAVELDKAKTNFGGIYPKVQWAQGVGAAIKAFMPVYNILAKEKGIFGTGVSIGDFKRGINTIVRGMIGAAWLFNQSKVKFDEKKLPGKKWSLAFTSALRTFLPIYYLMEKSRSILGSGVTMMQFKLGMEYIAKGMVSVSKILKDGKWDTKIEPTFMKRVGQNILDFNNIVQKIAEAESNKGFFKKLGSATDNLLGTDPISQVAKRMMTLAKAYDKLASSLIKLGGAMKSLNISDARMLGGITRSIVEGKPIKTGEVISKTRPETTMGGGLTRLKTKELAEERKKTDNRNKIMTKKMDEVIKLLKSIDKSVSSVDEYISDQSGGKYPTSGGNLF